IVLRQPGDPVEQRAAHRVVEPFGRQRLRGGGQTGQDVAAQRFGDGVLGQVVRQGDGHAVPSRAIISTPAPVTSTRCRSGTSRQRGSSSYGSLASTTPSSPARTDSVSPHVVASSRVPLPARMFSLASGSAAARSEERRVGKGGGCRW